MGSSETVSGRGVLRKKDQIVLREEFDDWALLFDPDTGKVCGLNPVGVRVWKMIDGKRTVHDISMMVQDSYPDAPDSVLEDVTAFITEITEKGYATVL
ncbi:MAG: pyrroloquinoline quinone biosynthesis protein PqqD [Methanoregulaceae archaeon PtaB.Bin009]|jgi:SynChlorMet cassette protein ScmD|nr:MAG: pyrroloquinoline quinone biosynthesis protein PqqD [Methanoregulaceae archaeon PtaB.Bin009]OPY38102.1 MAG: pyrroloquinoline quinone biosynthesis protein PqqD [Methanoregulaceae archaeon PtaU1.Bin066]HNQ29263.1 PqqD family peptide modification chaperone [Methanolinea sp.]